MPEHPDPTQENTTVSLTAAAIQTAQQHLKAAHTSLADQRAQHTPGVLAELIDLLRAVPATASAILGHRDRAAITVEHNDPDTSSETPLALPQQFFDEFGYYRETLHGSQIPARRAEKFLGEFAAALREVEALRLRHSLLPEYPPAARAGLHLLRTGDSAPAGIQARGHLQAAEQALEAVAAAFARPQVPTRLREELELFAALCKEAAWPITVRISDFISAATWGQRTSPETQRLLRPLEDASSHACSHLISTRDAADRIALALMYLPGVDTVPGLRL